MTVLNATSFDHAWCAKDYGSKDGRVTWIVRKHHSMQKRGSSLARALKRFVQGAPALCRSRNWWKLYVMASWFMNRRILGPGNSVTWCLGGCLALTAYPKQPEIAMGLWSKHVQTTIAFTDGTITTPGNSEKYSMSILVSLNWETKHASDVFPTWEGVGWKDKIVCNMHPQTMCFLVHSYARISEFHILT